MARNTAVISLSLPPNLTKAMDALSHQTDQTRSELVRSALREYLLDVQEDRERFLNAYKATRKEKIFTMDQLRTQCNIL